MQKITLLGTGTSQGVPVIGCNCDVCCSNNKLDKRLRTSAFIEIGNTRLLIDAGPDLRQQLLREKIESIDAILMTHEHKDHLAGLDDVRPIYFKQNSPIDIFGMQRVLSVIRKDFDYAFKENPYPGAPAFNLHPVRRDIFFVNNIEIQPIQVRHLTLPILGYRIADIVYITDASFISMSEFRYLQNVELLVINSLRIKEHYSHFNLEQALDFINKVAPKQAVLTHVSHEIGLYHSVEKLLPKNVTLGYDGFQFIIDK